MSANSLLPRISVTSGFYYILLAVICGTVGGPVSLYLLWRGQQAFTQAQNSGPLLHFQVDRKSKLSIVNRGQVDIEDIGVFVTTYWLRFGEDARLPERGLAKIESFTTPSARLGAAARIQRQGGGYELSLTGSPGLAFFDGVPNAEQLRTVYCFRIVFRNAVTKQRFVHYLITPAAREMPNAWDVPASSGSAMGGGYETSLKVIGVRKQIRTHQAELFDDLPIEFYRGDDGGL